MPEEPALAEETLPAEAEAALLVDWAGCVEDAQTLLAELSEALAAQQARDEGSRRVVSAALRTLADCRAAVERGGYDAECAMLARLDTRLQDTLSEATACASARAAALQRVLSLGATHAAALQGGWERRRDAASDAARELLVERDSLLSRVRDAEARLGAVEAELAQTREREAQGREEAPSHELPAPTPLAKHDVAPEGHHQPCPADCKAAPPEPAAPKPARARTTREPASAAGVPALASEEDMRLRALAYLAARSAEERWAAHQQAWARFCAAPPEQVRLADLPFPDIQLLQTLRSTAQGAAVDARKLRADWHPDRFVQRYGARLAPEEREEILAAVGATASQINALGL